MKGVINKNECFCSNRVKLKLNFLLLQLRKLERILLIEHVKDSNYLKNQSYIVSFSFVYNINYIIENADDVLNGKQKHFPFGNHYQANKFSLMFLESLLRE